MFKEYKSEMDKLTKKVKLLDNEKSEILKRYATKTRPHDTARGMQLHSSEREHTHTHTHTQPRQRCSAKSLRS